MKLTIDQDSRQLFIEQQGEVRAFDLYSPQAFEHLSREWLRLGWALRYYHNFSWLGRPVLQLPEDLLRLQEVIFTLRPDVIIETGVFAGGSLVFSASLCELLGQGRVIGVDFALQPGAHAALTSHPLAHRIELLEGDSTSPQVVRQVKSLIRPGESVLVLLDSDHSRRHVLAELEAYAPLVTPGSYIIVADGIMQDLTDVPGGDPRWIDDNPGAAARHFLASHPEFESVQPPWLFHDGPLTTNITYWPGGWLRRRS